MAKSGELAGPIDGWARPASTEGDAADAAS